jgi:hypothetical protein
MSWIVERLLIDRSSIRSGVSGSSYLKHIVDDSMESDTFNRLLFLEKKVDELYKDKYITDQEMLVIRYISNGYSITEISNILNLARITISNIFRNACNRISFHLGGNYTDNGFLEELKEDYRLTDTEIEKVKNRINSNYRHILS